MWAVGGATSSKCESNLAEEYAGGAWKVSHGARPRGVHQQQRQRALRGDRHQHAGPCTRSGKAASPRWWSSTPRAPGKSCRPATDHGYPRCPARGPPPSASGYSTAKAVKRRVDDPVSDPGAGVTFDREDVHLLQRLDCVAAGQHRPAPLAVCLSERLIPGQPSITVQAGRANHGASTPSYLVCLGLATVQVSSAPDAACAGIAGIRQARIFMQPDAPSPVPTVRWAAFPGGARSRLSACVRFEFLYRLADCCFLAYPVLGPGPVPYLGSPGRTMPAS